MNCNEYFNPCIRQQALHFLKMTYDDTNEDGIPIRKIHVKNLHAETTSKDLRIIFKRFGDLDDCKIYHAPNNGNPIYAFITFAEVESAKKALTSVVFCKNKKLKISPADTWHQPRDSKKNKSDSAVSKNNENNSTNSNKRQSDNKDDTTKSKDLDPSCSQTTDDDDNKNCDVADDSCEQYNILDILNDDCIIKIFSYLPVKYLIRSERVSKKWRCLVNYRLQNMRIFKTSSWAHERSPLTTNTLRTLLIRFGNSLRRLHLDYQWSLLNERTPQIIAKNCPNLTEILLTGITAKNWKPLLENCTNLKSLSFISCEEISDRSFADLKGKLEELTITNSHQLSGEFLKHLDGNTLKKLTLNKCLMLNGKVILKYFEKFQKLKKLCLDHCSLLLSKHLNAILKLVPQLTEFSNCSVNHSRVINIDGISELSDLRVLLLSKNTVVNDSLLKKIVKGCSKLTTLDISMKRSSPSGLTDEGVSYVWKLPDLEVLGISDLGITDKVFDQIAVNENGAKLRTLVCRHNDELTNGALVRLVQLCPEITKIDAYGCYKVNEEFVKSASEAVMLHPNRTEKLLLHVAHIDMFTEKSQEVIRNIKCPLLKVETTEDFCDPLLHSYKICCDYNNLLDSDDDDGDDYDDLSDMFYYDGWDDDANSWGPDDFYDDDDDSDMDDGPELLYKNVDLLRGAFLL